MAFLQRAARRTGLWPGLIFLAALLPRLSALGRYVTPDELNWVYRSVRFREALLAADWGSTLQSGHPGVVTMWIGAAAVQLQVWLREGAGEQLAWLAQLHQLSLDNVEAYRRLAFFLDGGRLGVALITSLGIVAVYLVGKRVVGQRAALAGGLLLALDPFFAGLAGLLHVDALLTIFTALALLLALAAARTAGRDSNGADGRAKPSSRRRPDAPGEVARSGSDWPDQPPGGFGRYGPAVMAGICTGLALLSKTPALMLLPFIAAIFLWAAFRGPAPEGKRSPFWRPVLLWAGGLLGTALVLLPALWAAPLEVLETVAGLSGRLAGDAVRPTFFLGEAALDPGPLFYPVAVLFRLSPAVFLGLLLLAPAWKTFRAQRGGNTFRTVGWFLLFVLAFLVFISLVAKKHDRYALPALMALTLAAGWGMGRLAERGSGVWRRMAPSLICLQAAYLVFYLPYPLMAYNWLAGGGRTAAEALPAGWGEGAGAGARWLAETVPNPEAATLFTTNTTGTAPFFPGEILRLDRSMLPLLEEGDYVLLVQGDAQLELARPAEGVLQEGVLQEGEGQEGVLQKGEGQEERVSAILLEGEEAAQRLTLKGATWAMVYEDLAAPDFGIPSLEMAARDATFGGQVAMTAAGVVPAAWPDRMLVGVTWERRSEGAVSPVYQARFSLVDGRERVRASWERTLLNRADLVPGYWPAGAPLTVYYAHQLPPDLPPGEYGVRVEVFNAQGERLGVFDSAGRFQGVLADAGRVTVPAPAWQPALEIPERTAGEREAAGYGPPPEEVGSGETLTLDLWWQVETAEEGDLVLLLGDAEMATTLDTRGWRPGQIYHILPSWRLPAEMEAGRYGLRLQWVGEDGRRWPEPVALGEIDVAERNRSFELPEGITPLNVRLGTVATLQAVRADWEEEALVVQVVWQANEPDEVGYTTFVHLWNQEGGRVDQVDRPPEPPTNSWVGGQVITETYRLARPEAGVYTVAMGLYDATSGQRLPAYDADGERLENDQYLLEVTAP